MYLTLIPVFLGAIAALVYLDRFWSPEITDHGDVGPLVDIVVSAHTATHDSTYVVVAAPKRGSPNPMKLHAAWEPRGARTGPSHVNGDGRGLARPVAFIPFRRMTSERQFHSYAALEAAGDIVDFPYRPRALADDQVEIEIDACGVCHSDLHQRDNNWGVSNYPLVIGHEIIGRVAARGACVSTLEVGQRVGVGPQISSCRQCDVCRAGRESLCKQMGQCYNTATGDRGQPYTFGGFSDRIRCPADWTFPIPDGLDTISAAPLMCAGLTTWDPFMRHGVKKGDVVGVIGIGGLGHIAIQFAHALGYDTTAISSSSSKRDEAMKLGANRFLDMSDVEQVRARTGSFSFLLATVSADVDWTAYLSLLKPEGILCSVGLPNKVEFNPFALVMGQLTFVGSILAPRAEIARMLQFAADHKIQAVAEVLPMNARNCNEAMARLKKNAVRYRLVLVRQRAAQ